MIVGTGIEVCSCTKWMFGTSEVGWLGPWFFRISFEPRDQMPWSSDLWNSLRWLL